jgi:hypothetical protein
MLNYRASTYSSRAPIFSYRAPTYSYRAPIFRFWALTYRYRAPIFRYRAPTYSYIVIEYKKVPIYSCRATLCDMHEALYITLEQDFIEVDPPAV